MKDEISKTATVVLSKPLDHFRRRNALKGEAGFNVVPTIEAHDISTHNDPPNSPEVNPTGALLSGAEGGSRLMNEAMNEFTIRTLSPMEYVMSIACESEIGGMGQIRIGTVLSEDKKGPRLTIQFRDIGTIEIRSLEHALFQARMWREYAQTFDGRITSRGIHAAWVAGMLRMSRRQCLARARAWVVAAGMWNQAKEAMLS